MKKRMNDSSNNLKMGGLRNLDRGFKICAIAFFYREQLDLIPKV